MKFYACRLLFIIGFAAMPLYAQSPVATKDSVAGFDLETAWIERNPKDYNPMHEVGSNDRPQPGETNWWELHVYNNSLNMSDEYIITWRINGMTVGSNSMPCLDPQTLAVASNRWIVPDTYTYDFSKPLTNIITADITAAGDARTNNNVLSVYMDALTFQIGVYTGTFWQYTIPDSMSFYEHMNILFTRLNRKLSQAVFPRSPNGILDRYRIDTIYISPNTMEGLWYTHPYHTIRSYFSEDVGGGGFYNYPYYFIGHTFKSGPNGIFSITGMDAFIHEAGHSLQLPDIYNYNLNGTFNYVNPGVTVNCTWMNPPGKKDIMNDPYSGEASVFTEYESIAANLQPGIQRPVTPEMINGGPGNTNWGYMFRDLPARVGIKVYDTSGRELDGAPVDTYRGTLIMDGSWPNLCFRNTTYHHGKYSGGYSFYPNWQLAATFGGKMSNCFQIAVRGKQSQYFHVFDQPRFNYEYWLGQTNLVLFHLTNQYDTCTISQLAINNNNASTDSEFVSLHFTLAGTPDKLKVGNSEAQCSASSWLPFGNDITWRLPPDLGWHTVWVQVISLDYVPSPMQSSAIELVPEPELLLALCIVSIILAHRFGILKPYLD